MKIITNLPDTTLSIEKLNLEQVVDLVLDICNPENRIEGDAPLQCGGFMALAARRMAEYLDLMYPKISE